VNSNGRITKREFSELFDRALEVAADNAALKLRCPVPRNFEIEMHALTDHPRLLTKDGALESLYIGPDWFYRVIDVSVIGVGSDVCRVFVCVSGHAPAPLNESWNQPPGSGPFKQLLAQEIRAL
jgi:hypothetical protein